MAVLPFYLVMTFGLPLIGLVLLIAAGGLSALAFMRRRDGAAHGRYPLRLALIATGLIVLPTIYFFYVLSIP